MAADVVRARMDSALKKEAAAVLDKMGLSLSDAIRLLFVRVAAEKALPFEIRVPNAETQAAMREARSGKVARFTGVSELMADLNDSGQSRASPGRAVGSKPGAKTAARPVRAARRKGAG